MKIGFTPETHFLCNDKGIYHLANRIDMSYKGKPDQVGMEVIFLNDKQVKQAKKEGFLTISE